MNIEELKLLLDFLGGVTDSATPLVWFYLGYQMLIPLLGMSLAAFGFLLLYRAILSALTGETILRELRVKGQISTYSSVGEYLKYLNQLKESKDES